MARLGSSLFSSYLCQSALSSGAKLCIDFSCVFPFSSPWPCELMLPQLGPSYRVDKADRSSPVLDKVRSVGAMTLTDHTAQSLQ